MFAGNIFSVTLLTVELPRFRQRRFVGDKFDRSDAAPRGNAFLRLLDARLAKFILATVTERDVIVSIASSIERQI